MEIPFEGEVSKSIIREAVRLDGVLSGKIISGIFVKCLAIAVAGLIVASGTQAVKYYAFLLMAVFLIDIWTLIKWKTDYISHFENYFEQRYRGVISEQSLVFDIASGKSQEQWSRLVHHKMNGNIAIIYDSKRRYFIFHKSWFKNDIIWDDFTELVKTKTSPLK